MMISKTTIQFSCLLFLILGIKELFALPVCHAAEAQQHNWNLVFEENFDGYQLDTAIWSVPPRNPSMWARWISNNSELVLVKRGRLVCRAIPNPNRSRDTVPMLTGAVYTRGKRTFRYGRIEVRMRTNLQRGNFAAAWMSRQWSADSVPPYGEIDIVEVVDRDSKARHAFHTAYTQANRKHGLKNSFMKRIDVTHWHTYAVEWTPDRLVWTVDGKEVGRYEKPIHSAHLAGGGWTFDVPFYLLLNQSIMHGAHGIKADLKRTYETEFDWVRVYEWKNKH